MIVALSGGADSVALTLILKDLAASEGFDLVGAAHLNHQLRGADADADERFCRQFTAGLGLPIDVERIDIAPLAAARGVSIEQTGHVERHAFFARAAARLGASAIAVAHTKDDQAETFLLRLLRGAGPRGLGGMHPRSGLVVRPLIETTREDVRAFLQETGASFREDQSNLDVSIPRNRIRHELLPFLETRFTPGIVEVLDREAAIAREDSDYLDTAARDAAGAVMTRTPRGVELDIAALLQRPAAIARRIIRLAQAEVVDGGFVGYDAVEAVLAFAVSNVTGPIDLPGHRVNRCGTVLVLSTSVPRRVAQPAAGFSYQLEVPGRVAVPEAACAIAADKSVVPEGQPASAVWQLTGRGDEAILEARTIAAPLSVRNRRPGDRFRPLGSAGRKTLQDFFVDAKVNRDTRDCTPVIVDARGRIVWVAGHALAEEFRVTDTTRDVVILKRVPI